MSVWGKWLPQITVPSGGYSLGIDGDGTTADVAAGTHDSILTLCAALETSLQTEIATYTVSVSSTGIVTVGCGEDWEVDWGYTTDALETLLGYDGTEEVDGSYNLTATNRHQYGWYPGVISHGSVRGEGVAADTGWRAVDEIGRVLAGSGDMRAIKASRRRYERTIRYGAVRRSEVLDNDRGVALLEELASVVPVRWYPDRDVGTVSASGTEGDPASDRVDSTCDFWTVDLVADPQVDWSQQHPDIAAVTVRVSGRGS